VCVYVYVYVYIYIYIYTHTLVGTYLGHITYMGHTTICIEHTHTHLLFKWSRQATLSMEEGLCHELACPHDRRTSAPEYGGGPVRRCASCAVCGSSSRVRDSCHGLGLF
jgi:hypothetical protein